MKYLAAIMLGFIAVSAFGSLPKSEINALLDYVQGLEGAVFIRNGEEHAAKDAVTHLRLKWEKQEKKIRSAEDFITFCASKSSLSGKRYQIRFKNGSVRFCDDVLTEYLHTVREPANKPVQRTGAGARR